MVKTYEEALKAFNAMMGGDDEDETGGKLDFSRLFRRNPMKPVANKIADTIMNAKKGTRLGNLRDNLLWMRKKKEEMQRKKAGKKALKPARRGPVSTQDVEMNEPTTADDDKEGGNLRIADAILTNLENIPYDSWHYSGNSVLDQQRQQRELEEFGIRQQIAEKKQELKDYIAKHPEMSDKETLKFITQQKSLQDLIKKLKPKRKYRVMKLGAYI